MLSGPEDPRDTFAVRQEADALSQDGAESDFEWLARLRDHFTDATALAEAEARGRRQGLEWQLIETAPQDRSSVIVAVPSLHSGHPMIVGEAYYDPENGGWWWAGTNPGDYYSSPITETNAPPTLWQPMPAPPDRATTPPETQKLETGESD